MFYDHQRLKVYVFYVMNDDFSSFCHCEDDDDDDHKRNWIVLEILMLRRDFPEG